MQPQFNFVITQRANRVLDMNLPLVERDVQLRLELVGDHPGRDRSEHFAVLARFDGDDASQLAEALGELAHGVQLVRFAFGAALLENLQPAFIGTRERNRESLRKEIIAGVAGRDFYLIGFTAEADDIVSENDFSLCHGKNESET